MTAVCLAVYILTIPFVFSNTPLDSSWTPLPYGQCTIPGEVEVVGSTTQGNTCNFNGAASYMPSLWTNKYLLAVSQDLYNGFHTQDDFSLDCDVTTQTENNTNDNCGMICGWCFLINGPLGSAIYIANEIADINAVGQNGAGINLHIDDDTSGAVRSGLGLGYDIDYKKVPCPGTEAGIYLYWHQWNHLQNYKNSVYFTPINYRIGIKAMYARHGTGATDRKWYRMPRTWTNQYKWESYQDYTTNVLPSWQPPNGNIYGSGATTFDIKIVSYLDEQVICFDLTIADNTEYETRQCLDNIGQPVQFTDNGNTIPTVSCDGQTSAPVKSPTSNPNPAPTKNPTRTPSNDPTFSPSNHPSLFPTYLPTKSPTRNPTRTPTFNPTNSPSNNPVIPPTNSPIPPDTPTISPVLPTLTPSYNSSQSPSKMPTYNPTLFPSNQPSKFPSHIPTITPTNNPTLRPSDSPHTPGTPSSAPNVNPSILPSNIPSILPSNNPTIPTQSTSNNPSQIPTYGPTTECDEDCNSDDEKKVRVKITFWFREWIIYDFTNFKCWFYKIFEIWFNNFEFMSYFEICDIEIILIGGNENLNENICIHKPCILNNNNQQRRILLQNNINDGNVSLEIISNDKKTINAINGLSLDSISNQFYWELDHNFGIDLKVNIVINDDKDNNNNNDLNILDISSYSVIELIIAGVVLFVVIVFCILCIIICCKKCKQKKAYKTKNIANTEMFAAKTSVRSGQKNIMGTDDDEYDNDAAFNTDLYPTSYRDSI